MIDKIILFFINLYFGGPQGTYQDEHGIYDIDTHLMYEYFVDAPVEEKKVVSENPGLFEVKHTFLKEPTVRYFLSIDIIHTFDMFQESYFKMKVEKTFRDIVKIGDMFAFKDYPDCKFKVIMNPIEHGTGYIYPFKYLNNVCDLTIIRSGALFHRIN